MSNRETLTFVFVGHVDHGKSTLIGRLLYDTHSISPDKMNEINATAAQLGRETEFAYLLDHLEEERQQGITIETTQVFFKTAERDYIIIDAPGHVEFVKNMITGASHAEAAILIVDAQEGVKEQTKRHAYLLSLLGIDQVIVAINKMDLVAYREEVFTHVWQDVHQFLTTIGITKAHCVPIAALHGENITARSDCMPWYAGMTFLESLGTLQCREASTDKSLLLPVQDVYKIEGKRIGVGRVEAGSIHQGDTVTVLPHGQTTGIATIEKYPHQVAQAVSTECVGITMTGDVFCDRGDIVCSSDAKPRFVTSFYGNIFWLAKEAYVHGERLTLRCATQETTCSIERIRRRINSSTLDVLAEDAVTLNELEVGEVFIKVKKPIAIKAFTDVPELGRFVLVRGEDTCAGGIVVEANQ